MYFFFQKNNPCIFPYKKVIYLFLFGLITYALKDLIENLIKKKSTYRDMRWIEFFLIQKLGCKPLIICSKRSNFHYSNFKYKQKVNFIYWFYIKLTNFILYCKKYINFVLFNVVSLKKKILHLYVIF